MCFFKGAFLGTDETDSEDDGGIPRIPRHDRFPATTRGAAGNRNGASQKDSTPSSQQEIQPYRAPQITDRQAGCPIPHSHRLSEETDLTFKNNCELFVTSCGTSPKFPSLTVFCTPPHSPLSSFHLHFRISEPTDGLCFISMHLNIN